METFHFALQPGGYLFLGSSESVDGASDLYTIYNREHHIFLGPGGKGHLLSPTRNPFHFCLSGAMSL